LKGWDKKIARPPFCYDKKCKVIYSTYKSEDFKDGYSFSCYGKLPKTHIFIEKKAKHINNFSCCIYTPLKGMIRFFMCEDDLWGEAQALIGVMNRIKKIKCPKCKGPSPKVITHTCFKCQGN